MNPQPSPAQVPPQQYSGNPATAFLATSFAQREEVARRINEAMIRFPLILQILGELSKEMIPAVGDSDVRHGCERALTSMLAGIAVIKAAPLSSEIPGAEEEQLRYWLETAKSACLVDPDLLQALWVLIDDLLPAKGKIVSFP